MKKQSLNALAASYRADLLYYIERAKLGKCPPHWQAYCFGEIAAAKGTDAYPEDGDALLDELHRLVDTVPQITNREESAAEIAAYRGQMLFYFDRDYYTLAELVRLPDRKKYGACVYIDADGSRQDRPGYANDIALQVDEWRRKNGIPFDKSTIAVSPSEVDGGEFDTMDEALRYLYTCLNFPDSVLCWKKIPPEKGIRRDFLCGIGANGHGRIGNPPLRWGRRAPALQLVQLGVFLL